jgi:1-acyl-sn-glycerol-3-phosphate acyltransferase
MEIVYRPAVAILRALAVAKGQRWIVEGDEHLPLHGPVIVVANHISEYDSVVVGLALDGLGRRPRFLGKKELFDKPVLGSMLRNIKQIPVDRAGDRNATLPMALERLDEGEAVVLFPEGTISTSFVPAEPKHGAARLALASGAPVIPVGTWGGQRVGNPAHPVGREDRVALVARFGPAVPYEDGEDVAAVTARLWERVTAQVDEVQRTYPQQPRDEADRWWLPRHLGGTAPTVEEAAEERARKAREREARARARSDEDDGRP